MLTEQGIDEIRRRQMWALFPAFLGAVAAVFIYFLVIGQVRETVISCVHERFGETASDMTPLALILPAFVVFMLPVLAACAYVDRFKTVCPSCHEDISGQWRQVQVTRCCPSCEQCILEGGRVRSVAVYKRYRAIESRVITRYWMWAWPALGLLGIICWLFDQSALQQCPQCYWLPSLIGSSVAGWAWLRTFSHRYIPPLLVSIVLFGIGAAIFWNEV